MDQNTELNQQGGEGAGVPTKQPDAAPKKMILQALYGFYDDAGRLWQWVEGQIVDDVEHIKMLVERKAPAVEHKED
jgi:hypothetical protein